MTIVWPFGTDADRNDPLTAVRIAVTGTHPGWSYLVAFNRDSPERPTDAEAAMLASYLEEYKHRWYGDNWYRAKLAQRALDVDAGANGTIFRKYAPDDWGYRRRTWRQGPLFVPQSPRLREMYPGEAPLGPLSLIQLMDYVHSHSEEVSPRWLKWKADHPEVFPA